MKCFHAICENTVCWRRGFFHDKLKYILQIDGGKLACMKMRRQKAR